MFEHVAAVVVGCGDRGGQVGGRAQELRVATADGGSHGEERSGGGRGPVAGRRDFLFSRVELAEHHPDRSVQVLQDPVWPRKQIAVSGSGHLAHQDDVLASQYAVRSVQQGPNPFRGLGARVEEFRFYCFGVAVGAVDRPVRQTPLEGRGEVGAVGGHLPRVVVDVHGSRLGGAGFDEMQRSGGGPGRCAGAVGGHWRAVSGWSGAMSSPSPPAGLQSHSATTVPVSW